MSAGTSLPNNATLYFSSFFAIGKGLATTVGASGSKSVSSPPQGVMTAMSPAKSLASMRRAIAWSSKPTLTQSGKVSSPWSFATMALSSPAGSFGKRSLVNSVHNIANL